MNIKSYAYNSNQGPHLQINEDIVDTDLVNKLFILLDGFGGSNIGDKAVRLVKDTIKKFYTRIGGDPDSTMPFFYSHKFLIEGNALINSMRYAHNVLKDDNFDKKMSDRGGASGVVAALGDNVLTVASCGNCLTLLYRNGQLTKITSPDVINPFNLDNSERDIFSLMPQSAFGLFDDLELEIKEVRIKEGDKIILLSDGVYAHLSTSEIVEVLENSSLNMSQKTDVLNQKSNDNGNLDNQSSILLQF